MSEELDHQPPAGNEPQPQGVNEPQGQAVIDRLTLLASYVLPDGRLRLPGFVVVDSNGVERIVMEVDDRSARIGLRVAPAWSPLGTTGVNLYAEDGDDEDIYASPPDVGLQLQAGGEGVVELSGSLRPKQGVMGAGDPELKFHPWF